MRNPLFLLATVVLLLGVVVMRESRRQPISAVEAGFLNWLTATAKLKPAATDSLTLVEIDDNSLQTLKPEPWAPLDYALFLQASLKLAPAVVAIEEVLNWDSHNLTPAQKLQTHQHEKSLYDLLLKSPKVLLAAQLGSLDDTDVIPPLENTPVVQKISGPRHFIPAYTVLAAQPKKAFRLLPKLGFTNLAPGPALRSIPLLFNYRGEIVPSFVLQALTLWLKLTPEEIEVELGKEIRLGQQGTVPIDASGAMLVNPNARFTRVSYSDLLVASASGELASSKGQGGLFLLARTDSASRRFELPNGVQVSSGELFAMAISTVSSKTFIQRTPILLDLVLIVLAIPLGLWLLKQEKAVLFCLALFAFYLLTALAVFTQSLLVLPLLLPASLLTFLPLFGFLHGPKTQ